MARALAFVLALKTTRRAARDLCLFEFVLHAGQLSTMPSRGYSAPMTPLLGISSSMLLQRSLQEAIEFAFGNIHAVIVQTL